MKTNKNDKKRYSVLTYNINNYEVVHEVEQIDPEAEYIFVTDDKNLKSDTWTIIYDPDLEGMSVFDKCYSIRFNCFKYCNTDICIRIDGSMGLLLSLKPLINIFEEGKYDACLMPHPLRDNIQEEYDVWIQYRNYDRKQADRCISAMSAKGYNFRYKGLFQCGFVIQRRNETTRKIDEMTLGMLKELGTDGVIERLDQTVFTFVVNHYFSHLKVLPISSQILSSAFIQLYMHGGNIRNLYHMPDIRKDDIHYMFNKQVKCLYMPTPQNLDIIANREYQFMHELLMAQEEINRVRIEHGIEINELRMKVYKRLKTIRILIFILCLFAIIILLLISFLVL